MRGIARFRTIGVVGLLTVIGFIASACGPARVDGEGINVRRDFSLASGAERVGDQVIVAYRIALSEGSTITGGATLTADRVRFDGTVTGDVVVLADHLEVGNSARVGGDLVLCVKTLEWHDGARVTGDVSEECATSGRTSASTALSSGWDSMRSSALFRVSSAIAGALLFAGLAALITVIFPRPLIRMSESVWRSPALAGGVGLLTIIVSIALTGLYGLSLLLVLPVVLLPFVLVGWLIILLLSMFGWVALAHPFGLYLLRLAGSGPQPSMVGAAVGAVALVLLVRVWSIFWFTAWIGGLAAIVLGSVGLGAVILTRLGTRPYPRRDVR